MPLPNPGMSFTAFDQLPASDLNELVENIEALAAGTGLNDGVLATRQTVAFTPAGNTDFASGTIGDWVSMGNATVPTWATFAYITWSVSSYIPNNASNFEGRIKIGSAVGTARPIQSAGGGLNTRLGFTWSDTITLTGTGSQALYVQARRTSGTGTIRADTGDGFTAFITYV